MLKMSVIKPRKLQDVDFYISQKNKHHQACMRSLFFQVLFGIHFPLCMKTSGHLTEPFRVSSARQSHCEMNKCRGFICLLTTGSVVSIQRRLNVAQVRQMASGCSNRNQFTLSSYPDYKDTCGYPASQRINKNAFSALEDV